jgi:peptidoglycan/xylan/chitin deacetylase (PgdA/CDA1 family)
MPATNLPLRLLAGALSPAGPRARLSVLIYHRVLERPDPYRRGDPTVAQFDWQMALLAREFSVLPLADAVARLAAGTLPARAACVTFDDGYRDNLTLAAPVLRRHGVPATFFVATDYLDGGTMWNDRLIDAVAGAPDGELDLADLDLPRFDLTDVASRRACLNTLLPAVKHREPGRRADAVARISERCGLHAPPQLMLTSAELQALHGQGFEIGAHTCSHPILTRQDDATARRELADGRARLGEITGAPPRLFAYPNGKPGDDYDARHAAMARELGFDAAVCTAWGAARRGDDLFQIPRFTPWDGTPLRFHARLVANLARRDTWPARV